MGALLSCCACEMATCCATSACSCGLSLLKKSVGTRILYVILFAVISLFSWVFSQWSYKLLDWIPLINACPNDECQGALAVYRITWALAVFHFLMAVTLIGVRSSKDFRAQWQSGWWIIKLFLLIGLIVAAFFIPNGFFVVWAWIATFGAGAFIIFQLILLIDFAHSWSDNWTAKMNDSDDNRWLYALLGASIIGFVGALALTIVMYIVFAKSGCHMNTAFITVNLILAFVYTLFSINPKIKAANHDRSGLLQSAVLALYTTYLIFSSIMSEPTDWDCNPWNTTEDNKSAASTFTLIAGTLFTILAVCYSAFTASGSSDALLGTSSAAAETGDATALINKDTGDGTVENDEEEHTTYNYSFFHIIFCTGAMYVGMLLTSWALLSTHSKDNPGQAIVTDHGPVSVWVKAASSWITIALYMWSVCAPIFFPDRDWS